MSDPLIAASKAASNGLFAQSTRMRVLSENIANAETTGKTAGSDPYQRKTISFQSVTDDMDGIDMVQVDNVDRDKAPFRTEYMPGHPAADAKASSSSRTSTCSSSWPTCVRRRARIPPTPKSSSRSASLSR